MNAITLPSSECELVSVAQALPLSGLSPILAAQAAASEPEEFLNVWGGIATPLGSITPIGPMEEWRPEACWGDGSIWVACGLAAAAWAQVSAGATTDDRDAILCLTEDACPIGEGNLAETFGIEEHELQPARDRVAVRFATDPDFTAKFARARAIMNAACAFFPWYRGDGCIPN